MSKFRKHFSLWQHELRASMPLAIPMMIGQVGQMAMAITDNILVGHLGVVPLAAAAFANAVFMVMYVGVSGGMAPLSVLMARAHGSGQKTEVTDTVRSGLVLTLIVTILSATIIAYASQFLSILGQPPEVVREARPFLIIISWSFIPAMLWQGLRQYCESLGHPKIPMLMILSGVIVNLILSAALIYGIGPIRPMGLMGAGWGTMMARVLMLLAMIVTVYRMPDLRANLPKPRVLDWLFGIRWEKVREILGLGIPVGLHLLMEVGAFTSAAFLMGRISAEALAAHQIALTCASTSFMFPAGLSMAVSIRIGSAIGRKQWSRIRRIGFTAFIATAMFMACVAFVFGFMGTVLASWFVHEPEVIVLTGKLLVVAGIFQVFDGVQVVGVGALRGLTDVRIPMLIALVSYWLIAIPLAAVWAFAGSQPSPSGVWWGLAVGLSFAAVVKVLRFNHLSKRTEAEWKSKPTVEETEADLIAF